MRKRFKIPKIRKVGYWYVFRITDSLGKRKIIRSVSKEEAQIKLTDMLKQVMGLVSGGVVYNVSIEQAINFWLTQKKGVIATDSLERYKNYMDNFCVWLKEAYPKMQYVQEIRPEHIKEFMDYRSQVKKKSNKTVNSERQALNNLFVTLIEHNKIKDDNPVLKTKGYKRKPVREGRRIPDGELDKFFEVAKQESQTINWYGVYWTLYATGMRKKEAMRLQKKDISDGKIRLSITKNGLARVIPIHPQLKPVLEEAIARSKVDLIFPNAKGEMLHNNAIRDRMIALCKKAGIQKATVHDLRHTFASRQGMSDKTKQMIGGWKDKQVMERVYMHTGIEDVQADYFNTNLTPKPDLKAN